MTDIAKVCIQYLRPITISPNATPFLMRRFLCAQTIIRAFYAALATLIFRSLAHWSTYLGKTDPNPLWPVFWLNHVESRTGIATILWLYLFAGVLALIAIRWRAARIVIFLAVLQFLALQNSYGKINHPQHIQLFLSFILIFLPDRWDAAKPRKQIQAATLILFSGCQAAIMLTYTMSGFFKVIHIPVQIIRGQVNSLMPEALPLQVANRLLATDTMSLLGEWFIDHYLLAWPLMVGTIYLQLFALWAAFRPSLHQLWGLGLIFFHLATSLIMTILFWENCLWLALFFINSPFRPRQFDGGRVLRDLPLIDLLFLKRKSMSPESVS